MKLIFAALVSILMAQAAVVPVSQKTTKGVTTSMCSGANVWRLIYTKGAVKAEFQGNGGTITTLSLFCATTQAEADAQVTALKLTPLPAAQINAQASKPAVKPATSTATPAKNVSPATASPTKK